MTRLCGRKPGGQGQQRKSRRGNLRTEKHADIEPFAGYGDPAVITAAAASQLLICEIDGAVRGAAVLTVPARGGDGIGVCRSCRADIVQPAGENRAGEFNVESGEMEHYFTRRSSL